MSREEVESQMRLHGIHDIAGVPQAYLEPNGMISVLTRDGEENGPVERPEMRSRLRERRFQERRRIQQ